MGSKICHVEIPCKDMTRAKKFYEGVFGWDFEDFGESYALFNTGGELGGGLDLRTEESAAPGVMIYLEVDDISKTLGQITKAGGQEITGKTEISGGHGYFAVFTDSEGNHVGLWSKT